MSYLAVARAIVLGTYEIAQELLHERRRRLERERWAATPAPIRACPRCGEIAFTPGQVVCSQCGSPLG